MLKGLLFGGLFLVSLMIVSIINHREPPKNSLSYEEVITLLQANKITEINLKDSQVDLRDSENVKHSVYLSETQKIALLRQGNNLNIAVTAGDDPPALFYLFQILFWLFLISPPVIVILLLVIIRKMDAKK